MSEAKRKGIEVHRLLVGASLVCLMAASVADARPPIRREFFKAYPSANNTILDNTPNQDGHCGVCHFDFNGGGTRNPYGLAVEATPNRTKDEILGLGSLDSDGDGFTNDTEITDTTTYVNTPTFPGLTPANIGQVTNQPVSEIQSYLVPSIGSDTTPPTVAVIVPNGGESYVGNAGATVQWTAGDASGIAAIDLFVSLDNGVTFSQVAKGLSNTGSYTWYVANRPTTLAIFRVEATDNAFNKGHDDSDAVFTVTSPPGGVVPSTLRDFDMPGSQPFESGILNPPTACSPCHGNYDTAVEPYFNWQGSMMAQASHDPLMLASLAIANQDAPDSGDICLRCHFSRGWHQGRSVPTDGSQMLDTDKFGVSCDYCHRLVDPIYDPGQNPSEDQAILAALSFPGTWFGTGMAVVDPTGARRGPFIDATSGHPILVSPFHREAALCGTCHDVSNPAFETDGNGNYLPGPLDAPATNFSAEVIAPVERTYSEWLHSEYNTPGGVYAPEFGGNKDYVSTCQDCHMRDVTGQGCNMNPPTRTDLPLHDQTGGSTWIMGLISSVAPPGAVNDTAMQAAIPRARYMLQNAAELAAVQEGNQLKVTVTNNTGHKLPTGYPEGRRIWINIQFYDASMALVGESAHYDAGTGDLTHDAEAKVYEIHPVTSGIPTITDGTEFHFALNNAVAKDNRIPPRGFTNAAFAAFGGPPVDYSYADGQYWDDTYYDIPSGAVSADVTLYYQSASKEFVEFLRDENTTNSAGQDMYDLWNNNGKCPPETMATAQVAITPPLPGDFDGDGDVDLTDYTAFADCLAGPNVTPNPVGPGGTPQDCLDAFDFGADGDVDEQDFATFAIGFTG